MYHDCPYLPNGLKSLHDSKRFYNMMDINGPPKTQKIIKKSSHSFKHKTTLTTPKPQLSEKQKRLNAYLEREKKRSQQLTQQVKAITLSKQQNETQESEHDNTYNNYRIPVYQYNDENATTQEINIKQPNRDTVTPMPKYNTGRLTPAFTPSSISNNKANQIINKGELQQTPLLTPYQQSLQRNKMLNNNRYNPQSKQNTGYLFNNMGTQNMEKQILYDQNSKDVQTSFVEQYYCHPATYYKDQSEYMLIEDIDGSSFSSNGLNSTLIYSNNKFFDKQDVPILTCTKCKSEPSSPKRKPLQINQNPNITDHGEEVQISYHSPKLGRSHVNDDGIIMNVQRRNSQLLQSKVNIRQSQIKNLEQADISNSPVIMVNPSQYHEYNDIYNVNNPILKQLSIDNDQNMQYYQHNAIYQQSNLHMSDLAINGQKNLQRDSNKVLAIKNMKFLMIIPDNMNNTLLKVFEKLNLIDYLIDNQQRFVNKDLLEQMAEPQDKTLFIWQHKTVITNQILNLLNQNQFIANNYIINHYQNIERLTNKRNFHQLVKDFKSPLIPKTYSLPSEYKTLCRDKSIRHYIIKASGLSRGRGITLAHHPLEINYKYASIAQEYIDNPLLINGKKCDFRLYALIDTEKRFHLYKGDGICRISPNLYNMQDHRLETHITNTSVSKQFQHDSRMSVQNFLKSQNSQVVDSFWNSARQCVQLLAKMVKRDVSIEGFSSFELLGFDMLLTERLKPYLIEVNASPSLVCDCQMDYDVKVPLIINTFLLLEGLKDAQKWELIL